MVTLAWWLLFLPLTNGIGVTHDHFVHPGERLGEEDCTLKEAQVASMKCQGKDHIRLLCWKRTNHMVISPLYSAQFVIVSIGRTMFNTCPEMGLQGIVKGVFAQSSR